MVGTEKPKETTREPPQLAIGTGVKIFDKAPVGWVEWRVAGGGCPPCIDLATMLSPIYLHGT